MTISLDKPSFSPEVLSVHHKKMCDAVLAAGTVALSFFGQSPEVRKKADGSFVSEADLAVDAALMDSLPRINETFGWLSEESESPQDRRTQDCLWVIDPIDGTRAFIRGAQEWTISVALVAYGKPVLAAVYNPAKDQFFEAITGRGARLNGRPISVSPHADLHKARLFIPDQWLGYFENYDYTRLRANSIAYRICLVAAGLAEATVSNTGAQDWDIAAAHLILEEAGGKMTDFSGAPILYNQEDLHHKAFLSSNATLNEALIQIMKK